MVQRERATCSPGVSATCHPVPTRVPTSLCLVHMCTYVWYLGVIVHVCTVSLCMHTCLLYASETWWLRQAALCVGKLADSFLPLD